MVESKFYQFGFSFVPCALMCHKKKFPHPTTPHSVYKMQEKKTLSHLRLSGWIINNFLLFVAVTSHGKAARAKNVLYITKYFACLVFAHTFKIYGKFFWVRGLYYWVDICGCGLCNSQLCGFLVGG